MVVQSLAGAFYTRPVFFVALAFVLFFVLFGRTLWRAVIGVLDKRIGDIKRQLDEAEALRREAEAMLADAEAQRREAMQQAEQMIAGARDEAQRLSASMAAEAEAAQRRRERMAMERIAAAEAAVVTELRTAAIDLATEAAAQVLSAGLTQADDSVLIDRSIATLPASMRAA